MAFIDQLREAIKNIDRERNGMIHNLHHVEDKMDELEEEANSIRNALEALEKTKKDLVEHLKNFEKEPNV